MDSIDLSLIEISGADDSLLALQQSPNDGVSLLNTNTNTNTNTATNKTFFSCSPLLHRPRSIPSAARPPIPPSPIGSVNRESDASEPTSSSCKDGREGANKENAHVNKPEVAKLSLEPQQMKRKKKGGGFNLRKSLAWDRAFFTEEGVLDPSELSLLSGSVGKSSGGMLSVIDEGRESLCGGMDEVQDSPGLRALEEDLFKELPAKTPKKGRTIAGLLSPKPSPTSAKKEAGSASAAKRKVPLAQDINRSASKRSGCPRPVASSLQRPPNLRRTNAPPRDSKVSKPLALKTDHKIIPASSRTSPTTASQPKRSQIAQTATIPQKGIGFKGTSGNVKRSAQQDVKSVPSAKSTVKSTVVNARRNVSEQASSIPGKRPLANAQHPHVSRTNSSLEAVPNQVLPAVTQPSHGHGSSGKAGVSLSQIPSHSGVNVECAQSQIAKPSGLRRPSPSLGYFGQSKTSTQPFGSSQPSSISNSSISSLSKPGKLAHQRLPKPSTSVPADSSTKCSVASVVSSAVEGKIKPNLGSNSMEKMGVQGPSNPRTCVMTGYPQQLLSIHDDVGLQSLVDAEPCKTESNLEGKGLQGNANQLPVQNGPSEQLKKENDCEQFTDIFRKSRDLSTNGLDYSLCKPHLDLQAEVEDLSVKSSVEFNHGFEAGQNPSIRTNSVFSEVNDKSTSKAHEIRLSSMQGANEHSGEQDVLKRPDVCKVELSIVDSQKKWMNNSTLFEQTKSVNAVELNLKVQDGSASKLECSYGPYNYNDVGHTNRATNEVRIQSRELQVGDAQQHCVSSNLSVESGKSNLTTSTVAVDNLHLMIIDGPNENNAEQVGIQDPCPVTVQAFEGNLGLHTNASSICGSFFSEDFLERDVLQRVKTVQSEGNNDCEDESRVDESHMMEAVSTGTVEEIDVCRCSGDVVGMEPEDHHVSQDPAVQVKVFSGVNGTSEGEDVIERQDDSPVTSSIVSCYDERNCDLLLESGFLIPHNPNKQSLEQAGLINLCSPEVIQGNHNQNACADVLFGEGSFDSLKCNDGNIVSSGHELDIPPGIQQCEIMEQANELAEGQPLDSSLLADGQNSKTNPVVVEKSSSLVLDNVSECLEEHPHLQNPCPVVEEIPVELPDISSGDNSLHTYLYVESTEREVLVNVLANSCGGSDDCPSESSSLIVSNHGVDIDEVDHQPVDEMMPSSEGIRPLAENVDCCVDDKLGNDVLSSDGTPLENASSKKSEDGIVSALEASSEQLLVDPEDLSQTNLLPDETEISVPESECPSSEHNSDNAIHPKENGETLSIDKSLNQKKQVAFTIKPPANAVPFSEEWLAALEAAGEDILTMKGGAVQNSPPDKSLPEPSPWSPVRKKQNQEIGPFDCTKYTNSGIPPASD